MNREFKAELGVLGLLFTCPFCETRLYIPLEEISEKEWEDGKKEIICDGCGRKIKVIFEKEAKNEQRS